MKKILIFIGLAISLNCFSQIGGIGHYGSKDAGKQIGDSLADIRSEFDTVQHAVKSDTSLLAYDLIRESELVSRTIYVDSATGNDITGTGLIGAPFETIGRALEDIKYYIVGNITITIQLGEGTYVFTNDNNALLYNHYVFSLASSNYPIKIIGKYTIVESGLTITSTVGNPFIYNVSGATFTADQYKKYFVSKTGNVAMHPIYSNTINTLTCCFSGYSGLTNIRELKTKININSEADQSTLGGQWAGFSGLTPSVRFEYIEMNYSSNLQLTGDGIAIYYSILNNITVTSSGMISVSPYKADIKNCYIISNYTGTSTYPGGLYCLEDDFIISNCVIENNQYSNKGSGIYLNNSKIGINGDLIIAGFYNAVGILSGTLQPWFSTMYIINCTNFLSDNTSSQCNFIAYEGIINEKTYLNNVDYLLDIRTCKKVSINNLEYVDTDTSLISDFSPLSTLGNLINVGKNINIDIINNGFSTNLTDTTFIFRDSTVINIMQGVIPDTTWVRNKILELLP